MSDPTILPPNQQLGPGVSRLVDIMNRIAAIQLTITVTGMDRPAVKYASPFMPATSAAEMCPFFVNRPHNGKSDIGAAGNSPPAGTGLQSRDDQIDMILCVERRDGNVDIKFGAWDTALWVDAVYATFAQHLKLSNPATSGVDMPEVVDAKIKSWELNDSYELNNAVYMALVFSMTVRERYAQPYKA